ncbi:hypothetical protein THRCLA_20382 [Thraustotheca clavata]|uniref:Uncharacterized protein n=1 Tax=Thraustotheca clavata TaxID=74557 RepID=A0A1W0A878_9STRA|nr:hypothetical protein THRCLA_20382 [Thraustotheca clavata]
MDLEDSCESVDEEAELELSCALQDLAVRCKSFSAKMTDDLPEEGDEEEIHEEFECDSKEPRVIKRERSIQGKDWNYNQTKKELNDIQGNIRDLLARLAAEAKKSDKDYSEDDEKDAKVPSNNQRQEK